MRVLQPPNNFQKNIPESPEVVEGTVFQRLDPEACQKAKDGIDALEMLYYINYIPGLGYVPYFDLEYSWEREFDLIAAQIGHGFSCPDSPWRTREAREELSNRQIQLAEENGEPIF